MTSILHLATALYALGLVGEAAAKSNRYSLLTEKYGIEVQEAGQPGQASRDVAGGDAVWSSASTPEYEEYGKILINEFNKYPAGLIKASGLRKVVLCGDLKVRGKIQGGCASGQDHTLWLNVNLPGNSKKYKAMAIHHEFAHVIDYYFFTTKIYRWEMLRDWESLSGAEEYLQSSKNPRGVPDQIAEKPAMGPRKGFVSKYARTNVMEDRAELFAYMIICPRNVANRAENDVILKAKCEILKKDLMRACPDMNDQFWTICIIAEPYEHYK